MYSWTFHDEVAQSGPKTLRSFGEDWQTNLMKLRHETEVELLDLHGYTVELGICSYEHT